ncbi:MAG: beta-ketoacyl synthase chain length factor, partial [Bacteroidales bacterium]|nr:beta-ketoacyl synthase chain length factor [Bacteroidales bacterium]
ALSPTSFMQSTHNTVSSMIAIHLGCHGYNATYSHTGASLESALLDAWLQISLGDIDTALVGRFDEEAPLFSKVGAGENVAISYVLSADPEGSIRELTMPELCIN